MTSRRVGEEGRPRKGEIDIPVRGTRPKAYPYEYNAVRRRYAFGTVSRPHSTVAAGQGGLAFCAN